MSALKVVTYMMNAIIVAWFRGELWASENAVLGYCACHRLLLYLADCFPQLRATANSRIERFLRSADARHKNAVPDLGCFVQSICISDYNWCDVRDLVIEECFYRSVLYVVRVHPELGATNLDPAVDSARLQKHFETMKVSLGLMLFGVAFLEQLGKPPGRTPDEIKAWYDSHDGVVPQEATERLLRAIHSIKGIADFADFYHQLRIPCPPPMRLVMNLIEAVRHSREVGYHGRPSSVQQQQQQPPPSTSPAPSTQSPRSSV